MGDSSNYTFPPIGQELSKQIFPAQLCVGVEKKNRDSSVQNIAVKKESQKEMGR